MLKFEKKISSGSGGWGGEFIESHKKWKLLTRIFFYFLLPWRYKQKITTKQLIWSEFCKLEGWGQKTLPTPKTSFTKNTTKNFRNEETWRINKLWLELSCILCCWFGKHVSFNSIFYKHTVFIKPCVRERISTQTAVHQAACFFMIYYAVLPSLFTMELIRMYRMSRKVDFSPGLILKKQKHHKWIQKASEIPNRTSSRTRGLINRIECIIHKINNTVASYVSWETPIIKVYASECCFSLIRPNCLPFYFHL